jgi:urease accessory protein UreF
MKLEVSARPNAESERAIIALLEKLPLDLQQRVTKKSLQRWGKKVIMAAAARTVVNTGAVRRSLRVKAKAYGATAWAAVGHRMGGKVSEDNKPSGRALRKVYDQQAGWRAHFTEFGFHQWDPAWSARNENRAWRKGKRHRGRGVFIKGRPALVPAFKATAGLFVEYLAEDINKAVKDAEKGASK